MTLSAFHSAMRGLVAAQLARFSKADGPDAYVVDLWVPGSVDSYARLLAVGVTDGRAEVMSIVGPVPRSAEALVLLLRQNEAARGPRVAIRRQHVVVLDWVALAAATPGHLRRALLDVCAFADTLEEALWDGDSEP